jgi:hypothetical protein
MDAEHHANRILQKDQFRRAFDHANTQLTVRAMRLKHSDAQTLDVHNFVTAGLELAGVCHQTASEESPIDVLFWLRNCLQCEARKQGKTCGYKAACTAEIKRVQHVLITTCKDVGGRNVIPLLAS